MPRTGRKAHTLSSSDMVSTVTHNFVEVVSEMNLWKVTTAVKAIPLL